MIQDEFTDLQLAMVKDASGAKMQEFWRAVYRSDHWYFVQQLPPDGSEPVGPPPFGNLNPLRVRLEQKVFVTAFTSAERAHAAAVRNDLVHPEHGIPILQQDTAAGASMIANMNATGTFGVLFNQNEGMQGAFAPLGNVATMYEWFHNTIPSPMFDAFVRGVVGANAPQAWARLKARIMDHKAWYFVGDQDRPTAPQLFVHENEVFALVFTDEAHVSQGAGATGAKYDGKKVPLIPTDPASAIAFLQKVASNSDGKVRNALFNLGTQPFAFSIEELLQEPAPS